MFQERGSYVWCGGVKDTWDSNTRESFVPLLVTCHSFTVSHSSSEFCVPGCGTTVMSSWSIVNHSLPSVLFLALNSSSPEPTLTLPAQPFAKGYNVLPNVCP